MEPGQRKYFTEICLSVMTKGSVVFRPSLIGFLNDSNAETRAVLEAASIYLVCTKPKIRMEPTSLERRDEELHFELVIDTDSGRKSEHTVVPHCFTALRGVETVRVHPSLSFLVELLDADGNNAGNMPVEFFLDPLVFPGENLTHYEVLYVGQSRLGKSSGNIISRLESHSTLQHILSDVHANFTHREVFIMCFELEEPRYVFMMDPHAPTQTTDDQDTAHVIDAMRQVPTPSQITSIAEACYIRYFRPIYNQRLKNNFPSTDLKLLQSCYALDFNAIVAEINIEDLDGVIYSQSVLPSYHHIIPFDLHTPEDRRSYFEISSDQDGQTLKTLDLLRFD